MVRRATETCWPRISPPPTNAKAECSSWVSPDSRRSCAAGVGEPRPVEIAPQPARKHHLVGNRLAIDVIVVAGTGAHAQEAVLPDLDQPFRRRMQADHQRLLEIFQLVRNRDARYQRDI